MLSQTPFHRRLNEGFRKASVVNRDGIIHFISRLSMVTKVILLVLSVQGRKEPLCFQQLFEPLRWKIWNMVVTLL